MLLRPLGVSDEEQALQAHEELAQDGFEFLFELEQESAWPVYCGRLESQRRGVDLPEGRVPATFLVAEAEGQIVGRVSIRHELNAYLAEVRGHIGYGVRWQASTRQGATQLSCRYSELSLIHISEPTRQAEISYAVFCLKKKK